MDGHEHELSREELQAIELCAQLAALSPEDDPTAVRITLRIGNGRLVGEALLSAKAVEALTDSVISLNGYREDDPDDADGAYQAALVDAESAQGMTQLEQWLRAETEGGQL
ncbi:hypothetical protein [Streptomyces sp. NPDC060001]|uniref:hypothetical protein n=1 Tax=Streptomyces sp. NPDC060001 TaxID=3347032 RepID=UPI0036BE4E21